VDRGICWRFPIQMKTILTLLVGIFIACTAFAKSPFTLAVVPSNSESKTQSITIAKDKPREFYVILTDASKEARAVFQKWNSWGYQNVCLEFTTEDGKKFIVSMREQDFTRNFPGTFLIQPGEHQVYPIKLDEKWEITPNLTTDGETKVTLKAIYRVPPTPEATEHKVWVGRVESKEYNFTLHHW